MGVGRLESRTLTTPSTCDISGQQRTILLLNKPRGTSHYHYNVKRHELMRAVYPKRKSFYYLIGKYPKYPFKK
jgi:hypothetical protein